MVAHDCTSVGGGGNAIEFGRRIEVGKAPVLFEALGCRLDVEMVGKM